MKLTQTITIAASIIIASLIITFGNTRRSQDCKVIKQTVQQTNKKCFQAIAASKGNIAVLNTETGEVFYNLDGDRWLGNRKPTK